MSYFTDVFDATEAEHATRLIVREELDKHTDPDPDPDPDPDRPAPLTREEVETIVREVLADYDFGSGDGDGTTDAELDAKIRAILENLEKTRASVEFPGRRVGPRVPAGDYHAASRWGIHFRTNRSVHIRDAVIDAQQAGEFVVKLARYDGKAQFDVVDKAEISAKEGIQEITLDLTVPDAGEYLLTRDGDFAMRRTPFAGWDSHMSDGLKLIGGSKPGDFGSNYNWYYFFDLSMAATPDSHLED